MEVLVCKMCGSNELRVEEGLFVCQHCGTRYTKDEAKGLYSQGIVDVRVDNSNKLKNLYIIARDALKAGNYKGALSEYKEIQRMNPEDWEATLYVPALGVLTSKHLDKSYVGMLTQLKEAIPVRCEELKKSGNLEEDAELLWDVVYQVFLKADGDIYSYSWDEEINIDFDFLMDAVKSNFELAANIGNFLTEAFPKDSDLSKCGVLVWKLVIDHACSYRFAHLDKESFYLIVEKIKKFEPEYTAIHEADKPKQKMVSALPQEPKCEEPGLSDKWWFIILVTIVFWPIGLFLIFRKMFKSSN